MAMLPRGGAGKLAEPTQAPMVPVRLAKGQPVVLMEHVPVARAWCHISSTTWLCLILNSNLLKAGLLSSFLLYFR